MPNMTSTIGIPIKLLNEATGHIVTVEITSGNVYRGKLLEAEDNMNCQLRDITVTARDGRVSHLDQVYIRGSHVRYFIVPDMLRNAPMFRARNARGRGVGLARGRATVNRARGQRGKGGWQKRHVSRTFAPNTYRGQWGRLEVARQKATRRGAKDVRAGQPSYMALQSLCDRHTYKGKGQRLYLRWDLLLRASASSSQHGLTIATEITGSAPTPDASTGSLAGITHEWNVKTAYYTAAIPIWIDEITDTTAWKSEFLNTEAKEVVQAVGAWIYCFNSSDVRKESGDGDDAEVTIPEHVEATMKAVAEVVEKACGMMWDGTRLAVDLTPANKGRSTINAEEICLDLGFEYIHMDATGKNEYGENLGLERAKEALEANEWSASSADDDDDEDNVGGMDDEQAQMNAELCHVGFAEH
ncbi:hypothetical protein D6C76_10196 [Aureobasidium pullulans]|nr:hypothetical protein D6C76_10196 [Aureobasidium pullulans]